MQARPCGRRRGAGNKAQILDLTEPTPLRVHELPAATATHDHALVSQDFPASQTEAERGPGPGASKSGAWVPSTSPGGMSWWSDGAGAEPQLCYLPDLRQVLGHCLPSVTRASHTLSGGCCEQGMEYKAYELLIPV